MLCIEYKRYVIVLYWGLYTIIFVSNNMSFLHLWGLCHLGIEILSNIIYVFINYTHIVLTDKN